MRFLLWLFDASRRHYGGIRRYEKGGTGVRILTPILSLLFLGVTLGLEYWLFSSLHDSGAFGGGVGKIVVMFFIGLLFFAFAVATLEFCAVYAFTAFRMAAWGVALSASKRRQVLSRKKGGNTKPETQADPAHEGKYKAFDIVNGVLQIVFILALIGGVAAVAVLLL